MLAVARVKKCHAEIVVRDRVVRIGLQRLAIIPGRFGESAALVHRDTALVPQLRAVRRLEDQVVVERDRALGILAQQVHLGHRLQHERPILAAFERKLVLALRLGVVALLPEREPEVVVREFHALAHLHHALRAALVNAGRQLRVPAQLALVDREVGLRARQRRIELHRALVRGGGLLVPSHVAVHEAQQELRVGILGIQLDRALERIERFLDASLIVEHLAEIEARDRARGIEPDRVLEPVLRGAEIAARLLREPELDDGAEIVRVVPQQRRELGDGLVRLPEQRVRTAELPARIAVVHAEAQLLAQLGDATVVVARVEVRDLDVALRHLHLGVELERLRERGRRLLVQSLVVIEDAQVVVRARVGRIDAPRERLQCVAIAVGGEGSGHGADQPTRIARRMAVRLPRSGSSRKKPRSVSLSSFSWNSVSTQKT